MNRKKRMMYAFTTFIFLVISGVASVTWGQAPYFIGSASRSIEPPAGSLPLALGGYGEPREGRFSLEWLVQSAPSQLCDLSASGNALFALDTRGLLWARERGGDSSWRRIKGVVPIKKLVQSSGGLFAVTLKESVCRVTLRGGHYRCYPIKTLPAGSIAGAVSGPFLWTVDSMGKICRSLLSKLPGKIKLAGEPEALIELSVYGEGLVALGESGTIYRARIPENRKGDRLNWIQISRPWPIHKVTVWQGQLIAVNDSGTLVKGVHRSAGNLSVRSLAVRQNSTTVLVCTADLTGLDGSFCNSVKTAVSLKTGITPEAILINVSHTHFAPVTQAWPTWAAFYQSPDTSYLRWVKEQMVGCLLESLAHMKRAHLFAGRGQTLIGTNRRKNAHPAAPCDSTLDIIMGKDETGDKTLLFLAGCHPVFAGGDKGIQCLDGNFPAVAREQLQKEPGIVNALFMQGCAGDINPRSRDPYATGKMLARDVEAVINHSLKELQGPIHYSLDTIEVPVKPWPVEQVRAFLKFNESKGRDVVAEKNVRWARLMLQSYTSGKAVSSLPVYVQTITIGKWKLVGLSREVVNEYAAPIRALWPDYLVSVAGYCNEVSSYLPVNWHITEEHYEGYDSFFWYGQPALFPVDVKERILETIQRKCINEYNGNE